MVVNLPTFIDFVDYCGFVSYFSVEKYAEKLQSDAKNGQYIKLIPTAQVYTCQHSKKCIIHCFQLISVLNKIKKPKTTHEKAWPQLEPLELPSPVSRKVQLQPLSTTSHRDSHQLDSLLGRSGDNDTKSDVLSESDTNMAVTKEQQLSDGNLRNSKEIPPVVSDQKEEVDGKSESSLQLSTASVPLEEMDEDFENMTEEHILEKLIALPSGNETKEMDKSLDDAHLPSNSDDEKDLNKVSEEALKQKKQEMDELFEKNRLQPGDEGFEYDKEMDFGDESDKESCGWDSSNSGVEDF